MQIIVLVKEVPDMERVRFDSERGVIDRTSAEAEINPFDRNALQAAVNLKQQLTEVGEDCVITALTMGLPKAEHTLRDVYARGADRCVLLTDRAFGGADTLATSHALAAAIHALGGCDLILCGEKTVDGDTAQVGPEVAQLLDLPHSCYVDEIVPVGGEIEVRVGELCGCVQLRRMTLPALVSVSKNIAAPQLPTLKRKLESLRAPVETLDFAALSDYLQPEVVGVKGSPTRVAKIEIPPQESKNAEIFDDYSAFAPLLGSVLEGVL